MSARLLLVAVGLAAGALVAAPRPAVPQQAALAPLEIRTLAVQGLTRQVRLYVPERLAERPALIVALHGSGGDGERFRRLTGGAFERLADEHGFLVAYPDALGGQWNECRARAPYRTALAGVDEATFLRAVRDQASAVAARELSGAFAVGYSGGAGTSCSGSPSRRPTLSTPSRRSEPTCPWRRNAAASPPAAPCRSSS